MGEKYEISILFKMVDQFTGGTGKVGEALARLQSKVSSLGHRLSSMGKDLSLKLTAPLMLLGGLAVKEAAEQEVFAASLEKVAGSAKNAWDMVERLEEFAAKTPFEMEGLVATTKRLLIMGVAEDELMGKMKMLSDLAVGSGMSFEELALHYGKVVERGKATSRELVGMSAAGIPIMDMIQKQFHLTEEQMMEAAGKGKITSAIFLKVLEKLTREGGIYAGETERRAKTLTGIFHRLKANTIRILEDIGTKIIEVFDLKGVLTKVLEFVGRAREAFEDFAATHPKLLKLVLVLTAMAAALGPMLVGLGAFIIAIAAIAGVSGLGLIIVALAAVGIAVAAAVIYWDEFKAALERMYGAVYHVFSVFESMIRDNIITPIKEALEWVDKAIEKIPFISVLRKTVAGAGDADPGLAAARIETIWGAGAEKSALRDIWNGVGLAAPTESYIYIKVSADNGSTATVTRVRNIGDPKVKIDTVSYVGWGDLVR